MWLCILAHASDALQLSKMQEQTAQMAQQKQIKVSDEHLNILYIPYISLLRLPCVQQFPRLAPLLRKWMVTFNLLYRKNLIFIRVNGKTNKILLYLNSLKL